VCAAIRCMADDQRNGTQISAVASETASHGTFGGTKSHGPARFVSSRNLATANPQILGSPRRLLAISAFGTGVLLPSSMHVAVDGDTACSVVAIATLMVLVGVALGITGA
jgi:hypothetical protein